MPQSARTIVVQNGPYCLQRKLHGCELQYWTLEIWCVSNCLKFQTGTDRWIWSLGDVFNSYNPFAFAILVPHTAILAKWFCFGTLVNAVAFLSAFRIAGSCVNVAAVHRSCQAGLLLLKKWPSCDNEMLTDALSAYCFQSIPVLPAAPLKVWAELYLCSLLSQMFPRSNETNAP